MKTEKTSNTEPGLSDESLVMASLSGDQQAFGRIVARYQRLLCSLAYASLGDISASEDVAQETFVEAWKKLGDLREPHKLRAWLCGILRFKVSHHLRKELRQPASQAEPLPEADVLQANSEAIEDTAMKQQEQALLWHALKTLPDTYRETLILYYREQQSAEQVAKALELSEDTVKQRLSRGRKLLQEKMMSFVEGALARSAPGQLFTAGVLAALASVPPPAKAIGVGVTATKIASTFKWATLAAFLATVSGFVSSLFALRANLDQSRTPREKRAVIKTTALFLSIAIGFVAVMLGLRFAALRGLLEPHFAAFLAHSVVLAFTFGYLLLTVRMLTKMQFLRSAERQRHPHLFRDERDQPNSPNREYISRLRLFGLPLVHAKFTMAEAGEAPAIGWIALGQKSYGLLFAWGGIAVAPISVGIVTVGVVSIGAVGFGLATMGTVGIGLLAMGASAIGYKAYGSLSAMGWESAFSQGFSLAKHAAIGPVAQAGHINNEMAMSIASLATVGEVYAVILGVTALLVIVPVVWYAGVVRRKISKPSV